MKRLTSIVILLLLSVTLPGFGQTKNSGLFSESGDIGNPILKGSTIYNEKDQTYLLTGGGNNIWFKEDQFQFLYKKIKGDFIITATVKFIGQGVAGHRMILKSEKGSIQCPNWSKDGKSIIYNSAEGLLYNYNIESGVAKQINSGFATQNNNDHVISPDGKMIAFISNTKIN